MQDQVWLWKMSLILVALMSAAGLSAQSPAFKVLYAQRMNLNTTLKIMLDFGTGTRHAFALDTGSVGIVVPEAELPASTQKWADGSIRYTSSGLVVQGYWTWPIDIRLDVSGAIAHVSVFAATSSTCVLPASNTCHAGSLPHMLGIGFGRPDSYASPDRNPLLHIRNMPSAVPSNYRITHTGVELGLANVQKIAGMHLMRLTSFTREGLSGQPITDYRTPSGMIQTNGGHEQKVSILIDTGIRDALVALKVGEPAGCVPLPPVQGTNCTISEGTKFALAMEDGASRFNFTMGDGAATTPSSGHWIHLNEQEGSFINTGIRPLAAFDIFYDATNGLFGLSPASD
jgi:hypothetical protein